MAIYNVDVSAWEPFLEPVLDDSSSHCELWSLDASVTIQPPEKPDESSCLTLPGGEDETATASPAQTLCSVSSSDPLNLTVTSNALDALLQSAFVVGDETADETCLTLERGNGSTVEQRSFAAFELMNATGHKVHVVLGSSFHADDTYEVS